MSGPRTQIAEGLGAPLRHRDDLQLAVVQELPEDARVGVLDRWLELQLAQKDLEAHVNSAIQGLQSHRHL